MDHAKWNGVVTDDLGKVVPLANVTVRRTDTGALARIYTDREGATPKGNPFQTGQDGNIEFFAKGGAYTIIATSGGLERRWSFVPIGTAQEFDIDELAQYLNSGVVYYQTKAQMSASSPSEYPAAAVVLADSVGENNGYYTNDGSGWLFGRPLPDSITRATIYNNSDVNAPKANISAGVNPSSPVLFFVDVSTPNTSSVTLTIDGVGTGVVLNAAGNQLSAGEWSGRVMLSRESDGRYRIANDPASALSAAQSATQAGAARDAAETAKGEAESAKTAAAGSATAASNSASTASTKASEAASSATAAAGSASTASTKASEAASSATSAAGSASTANTKAGEASSSATAAAGSASTATTQAGTATTQANRAKDEADRAEAAASSVNLPPIGTGDQGKALVVNSSEDGYSLEKIEADAGIYDTKAAAEAATIPSSINAIRLNGYYAAGDGGGAIYKRVQSEPSHVGKVQSSDGAWWELVSLENEIIALGGEVDGLTDVSSEINAALVINRRFTLPVGSFRLGSGILVDNSNMSGETESGPQGISFSGADARLTVLRPVTGLTGPAVTLRYGTGVSSHAQHRFSDFAIVGAGDQSCLRIENASMLRASNLSLRGGTTGLHLVSVLGSSFRDVRCDSNTNGVVVEKGSGFSYTNAIEFSNLNVGANTSVGFTSQDAVHNLTFIGGSVEGNGTQGVAGAGGMLLNFNGGIEGAVGANIMGMYFENNGGAFDLRLVNSGSEYVTVNVIGCNFNRTDPNKFVTNNIFCSGRINLVLIGCGFKGYGSYSETSGRLYVNHDGWARISGFGNKFTNAAAATGMQAFGNTARYRGCVASGGAALRLPLGWTSAIDVTGVVTVTHNLGQAIDNYSVVATCTDLAGRVQRVSKNTNNFQVVTENTAGTLTNAKFDFEVSLDQ